MIFRQANPEDLPQLLHIFEEARSFLRLQGVDQWQDGYPDRETVLQDIAHGCAYVLEEEGALLACASFFSGHEESYDHIDGAWLTNGPGLTIHRIAVASPAKGRGAASRLIRQAAEAARAQGCVSVRADTHKDNRPMRGLLEKSGFLLCGVIQLARTTGADGARVAYERVLL